MAGVSVTSFDTWLSEKLLCINKDVDLDVFVQYITGILDTDTSTEDKNESLEGIIGEILPDGSIGQHCTEILDKWLQMSGGEHDSHSTEVAVTGFDSAIHNLIVKQNEQAVVRKTVDGDDSQQKKAILAQYAHLSDEEERDNDAGDTKSKPSVPANTAKPSSTDSASTDTDLLVKNMNAATVKERERTERDRAKHESEAKRQKDKDDREKQKQKAQERKDTEKKRTQKGEKKR